MSVSPERLYSAKQAATICSVDDWELQSLLDRKYFTAFEVERKGGRTYRVFTRDQLVLLEAMCGMLNTGISPRVANTYLELLRKTNPKFLDTARFDLIIFRDGEQHGSMPHFLDSSDRVELIKALSHGGYAMPYKNIVEYIDGTIPYVDALGGHDG